MGWGGEGNACEETPKLQELNPKDLRFTQESVANSFGYPYHNGLSLREAVDAIQRGALNPSDICRSPLKVFKDENGIVWCENNRRLWVLRKADVSSVRVKFKSKGYKVRCLGRKREMLSDPQFYPKLGHGETSAGDSVGVLAQINGELRLFSSHRYNAETLPCGDRQYTSDNPQYTSDSQITIPALVDALKAIVGCFAFAAVVTCFATWIATHPGKLYK